MLKMLSWPAGILAILLTVTLWVQALQPMSNCEIINGREIDTHHCIPYCPPNPTECN